MEIEIKTEPKLKSLTIQQKAALIDLIDGGRTIKDVAKELEISKNTLHYIYKNKEKIQQEIVFKPVSKIDSIDFIN
jgi:hypothetical protein